MVGLGFYCSALVVSGKGVTVSSGHSVSLHSNVMENTLAASLCHSFGS